MFNDRYQSKTPRHPSTTATRRVGLSAACRTAAGESGQPRLIELALLIVPKFKTLTERVGVRDQKRIDHFGQVRFFDRIEAVEQRHQFLKGHADVHIAYADTLFDGEHHKFAVPTRRRHQEFSEPILVRRVISPSEILVSPRTTLPPSQKFRAVS
jgi:hypothetical protein